MATTGFPKYQLSFFHGKNRNLQSVFRTDDRTEYEAELKRILGEVEIDDTLKEAASTTQSLPIGEKCPDCGTPKIMGKKGLYCKPCYIAWAEQNKKGYKQY